MPFPLWNFVWALAEDENVYNVAYLNKPILLKKSPSPRNQESHCAQLYQEQEG